MSEVRRVPKEQLEVKAKGGEPAPPVGEKFSAGGRRGAKRGVFFVADVPNLAKCVAVIQLRSNHWERTECLRRKGKRRID